MVLPLKIDNNYLKKNCFLIHSTKSRSDFVINTTKSRSNFVMYTTKSPSNFVILLETTAKKIFMHFLLKFLTVPADAVKGEIVSAVCGGKPGRASLKTTRIHGGILTKIVTKS